MDALQELINRKRGEVGKLKADLATVSEELRILEIADSLRPSAIDAPPPQGKPSENLPSVGRKIGDISKVWRKILGTAFHRNTPLSYEDIAVIAEEHDVKVAMPSVRERVRRLVSSGFLSGDSASGFMVTEDAVKRFNFTNENGRS
jgi:hypothetical protein